MVVSSVLLLEETTTVTVAVAESVVIVSVPDIGTLPLTELEL